MSRLSRYFVFSLPILLISAQAGWGQCPADTPEISAKIIELAKSAPDLKIKRFNVSGATESEVREALDKTGPVDVYKRHRDALTDWTISWQWPGAETGKPDFSKAEPSLVISTNLPCWSDYGLGVEASRKKWDRFVVALIQHEKGHVEIAQKNFGRPAMAVRQAAFDSKLDARKANAIAENELEKIRQLDIQYDRETESGKKLGVKFP